MPLKIDESADPDTQVIQSMQENDPEANPERQKNPFVSLMSLAVRNYNYSGYFRVIPAFNKQDNIGIKSVEDLKQKRDLSKILKIEIKRIETDGKFV